MNDQTTILSERAPQAARFVASVADRLVLQSRAVRPNRMMAVIHATAQVSGVTVREILATDRHARVAHPRQIAMALCREIPGASFPQIGRVFHRDHSTVMHAVDAVRKRMTPELADALQRIREKAGMAK